MQRSFAARMRDPVQGRKIGNAANWSSRSEYLVARGLSVIEQCVHGTLPFSWRAECRANGVHCVQIIASGVAQYDFEPQAGAVR